jgi:pimeloyl-ACP methyl ester carboxylesterase
VQPVRVPTLAVYGADDPIPPVLAASEAGFFAAGYRRENVPGSKHFVHRDRPDEVTSLLLEWFSGSGRGAEASPVETPTG